MSEIEDRRQRAREAVQDALHPSAFEMERVNILSAVDLAVETATQVKLTPDILSTARVAMAGINGLPEAIEAAFTAAGFEVIK